MLASLMDFGLLAYNTSRPLLYEIVYTHAHNVFTLSIIINRAKKALDSKNTRHKYMLMRKHKIRIIIISCS